MEPDIPATGKEVDDLIAKLSPESAIKTPSRRRTELYMRNDEQIFDGTARLRQATDGDTTSKVDYFKLKMGADDDLLTVETLTKTTDEKVDELMAANAATQAGMAQLAQDNAKLQAMMMQMIQSQMTEKQNTDPLTDLNTETNTDPNTEPNTAQTDTKAAKQENTGVLQRSATAMAHGHHAPVTAIFTELENANVLSYTDFAQESNTNQRRTTDQFSLYLWYKENDQGNVIRQIEDLHKEQLSSTAYKARAATLLEALKNFSDPAEHTRMMVFLRALVFSNDATTQIQAAKVIKVTMTVTVTDRQLWLYRVENTIFVEMDF